MTSNLPQRRFLQCKKALAAGAGHSKTFCKEILLDTLTWECVIGQVRYQRSIEMHDVKPSDGFALLVFGVLEGVPVVAAFLLAFKLI